MAYVVDNNSLVYLYADGKQVGVLPATGIMLPMTSIGDTRASFNGLLLGCRFWDVNLQEEDIRLSYEQGPLSTLCQNMEDDCIFDFELSRGYGSVVRDRTGDRASHIVNGKWETVNSADMKSTYVLPSSSSTKDEVKKVTLVGAWTRESSGEDGRYGKSEKEVITLTYKYICHTSFNIFPSFFFFISYLCYHPSACTCDLLAFEKSK